MQFKKYFSVLAIILFTTPAIAWEPTKPITVVIPFAAGSGNEIGFRMVAQLLPDVKFVIENRPGAESVVGMNHFATAAPDGYTIAVPSCQGTWVTSPIWYANQVKYDPNDFIPIATVAKSPLAFFANIKSQVDSPIELIREANSRQLSVAVGGAAHRLAAEYFNDKVHSANPLTSVMYKGPMQAITDVAGGHVEFGIVPLAIGYPFVQQGKIKLIGLTSEMKVAGIPNSYLMSDVVPGLNIYACWNIVLPKDTPKEIVAWYSENFVPAIQSSDLRKKFRENFMFTVDDEMTTAEARAALIALQKQWQPIARRLNPNVE